MPTQPLSTQQPAQRQRSPIVNAMVQHLLQVIDYLQQDGNEVPFSLLLISEQAVLELMPILIKNNYADLDIDIYTLTTEDFITADFNHRYTLGCFIDPQLVAVAQHNEQCMNVTNITTIHSQQQQIATRLRDLFAQQSVIFLANSSLSTTHSNQGANQINMSRNLNDLGYILTPIADGITNKDLATQSTIINCWQFNLYDYKARPDWLNAKYWANPENYDKYRW
ncbi:DUF6231 family protein [Psychrobacter lutiphocae]|uniref:DUF6231 family protein n=1 Tax=Psychrobacter lutiphocae TaxID=540500 RepID=UPI00036B5A1A|nr:DUF6231 family protein [Psychrobacter lutiphocae]